MLSKTSYSFNEYNSSTCTFLTPIFLIKSVKIPSTKKKRKLFSKFQEILSNKE